MMTLQPLLVQYGPHGPHGPGPGAGWMPGGPGPWFGTGLGPWLWLAALLVVVAGAVLLLARVDRPSSSDSSDPALARLRERYAAGDVDDEEYRRRRAVLSGDNPGDA